MKKFFIGSLLFVTTAAFALSIAGVTLPDTFQAGGKNLILNGAGMRKKGGFIKVYAGGLYLQQKSSSAGQIIAADEPMAIKLVFVRDVGRDRIVSAWDEGFANSKAAGNPTSADKIATFNTFFKGGVVNNDKYDIIYVPGTGTTVKINGAEKGTIPGLDFKKACWGIWLCSKPADEGLKGGMLGK